MATIATLKVKAFNSQQPNTTYLQGFGWVLGTPAGSLKEGDTMVWNNGGLSRVGKTISETAKMITIEDIYFCQFANAEQTYTRKLKKDRIVARPFNEIPA